MTCRKISKKTYTHTHTHTHIYIYIYIYIIVLCFYIPRLAWWIFPACRPNSDLRHILYLTTSINYTSNNLPLMKNQRLPVQFYARDDGRCVARNMLSFIQIWNNKILINCCMSLDFSLWNNFLSLYSLILLRFQVSCISNFLVMLCLNMLTVIIFCVQALIRKK
jgi:hypothetical protein